MSRTRKKHPEYVCPRGRKRCRACQAGRAHIDDPEAIDVARGETFTSAEILRLLDEVA